VPLVGEHTGQPVTLAVGEQLGAGAQHPADAIERVTCSAAMPAGVLLDPLSAAVQRFAGQRDHVKRVHHCNRVGDGLSGGGLETGEPVHRHDLDPVAERGALVAQPGLEHLFGAAFDHIQQACRPEAVTHRGQVDDHGDELVAAPRVSPAVLVHADDLHAVESVRVADQHAPAFGQYRVVGGVPRDRKGLGDPGDRQVLAHDGLQRPGQRTTRQLRSRLGRPADVLAPHAPASGAAEATDRDQQCRGPPPERLVRQPPGHRVPRRSLASAATTPPVELARLDPTRQHRAIRLEPLTDHLQPELVESAERAKIRAHEGSVKHVEVFQLGGVRTSIIGRPRPSPRHRRAAAYTLNPEEPL